MKHHLIALQYMEDASECCSQFTVQVTTVHKPYFSKQNVDSLKTTLNYWGGRHFLVQLTENEEYTTDRESMLHLINCMLNNGDGELHENE